MSPLNILNRVQPMLEHQSAPKPLGCASDHGAEVAQQCYTSLGFKHKRVQQCYTSLGLLHMHEYQTSLEPNGCRSKHGAEMSLGQRNHASLGSKQISSFEHPEYQSAPKQIGCTSEHGAEMSYMIDTRYIHTSRLGCAARGGQGHHASMTITVSLILPDYPF